MSGFETSRQIWRQKLAVRGMLWNVLEPLSSAFDRRLRCTEPEVGEINKLLTEFERYSDYLDSPERIRALFVDWLQALKSGEKSAPVLEQQLRALGESCDEALAAIPASVDKAKGSLVALIDIADFESDQEYDAACLLRERVPQEVVTRVVAEWKEKLRSWLEYQSRPIPVKVWNAENGSVSFRGERKPFVPRSSSHIFWEGETLEAISRYRFMETFGVGEFPETVAQIESLFEAAFIVYDPDQLADLEVDNDGVIWVSARILLDLWLASRSVTLCSKIRNFLEMSLAYVSNRQSPEGWYPCREERGQWIPDNYRTALACVVLLRLASGDQWLERARKGVQWLVQQQEPNGAWTDWETQWEESENGELYYCLVPKPDFFTTLLAAEAIRLSGFDSYEHTVSSADSWIMSQQNPDGTWGAEGFPFPFMTVLAIEYFEERPPSVPSLEDYLGKDTALEADAILEIIDLAERKLRKVIRDKPSDERKVQDAFESLLIGADIPYKREKERIEYSSKTYTPDFTFPKLELALDFKFCGTDKAELRLIKEINDYIMAFRTKYANLLFIVYDLGFIRDTDLFTSSFEEKSGVAVRVIKH